MAESCDVGSPMLRLCWERWGEATARPPGQHQPLRDSLPLSAPLSPGARSQPGRQSPFCVAATIHTALTPERRRDAQSKLWNRKAELGVFFIVVNTLVLHSLWMVGMRKGKHREPHGFILPTARPGGFPAFTSWGRRAEGQVMPLLARPTSTPARVLVARLLLWLPAGASGTAAKDGRGT